jgi:hypothetical protein
VLDVPASNTHGFLLRDLCVSSTQQYKPIWNRERICPRWKTHVAGIIPFKTNTVLTGNKVLYSAASNIDIFLWEVHMFLQLCWIYLFGANCAYLHLETPKLQEVFLLKTIQLSQGNNVIDAFASITNGFLSRDICVSAAQL